MWIQGFQRLKINLFVCVYDMCVYTCLKQGQVDTHIHNAYIELSCPIWVWDGVSEASLWGLQAGGHTCFWGSSWLWQPPWLGALWLQTQTAVTYFTWSLRIWTPSSKLAGLGFYLPSQLLNSRSDFFKEDGHIADGVSIDFNPRFLVHILVTLCLLMFKIENSQLIGTT